MIIHHLLPSGKLTCHHFSIGDTDRYRYIFQGWMFFHCHVEFSAGGSSGRGRTVFAVISPSRTLVITITFPHHALQISVLTTRPEFRRHQSTKISFFMFERLCHQTSPDSMFLTFSSSWFSIFDNSKWKSATFCIMTSMTPVDIVILWDLTFLQDCQHSCRRLHGKKLIFKKCLIFARD